MSDKTKISLRKDPLPTAPPGVAPPQPAFGIPAVGPGLSGTLPLGDQAYVVPTKLTPAEEAALRKSGWTPGQPVPVPQKDLSPTLAAGVAAASREHRTGFVPPAPLNTPPLKEPDVKNIEDMPLEYQQELAASIKHLSAQVAATAAIQANRIPGAHPSINDAIALGDVPVVDDRPQQAARQPQPAAAPTPTPAPANETAAEKQVCDHCGFPAGMKDAVVETIEDKRAFRNSLRTGVFMKEVTVMDDLKIRFRTLRPDEVDLLHLQAYREVMRSEIDPLDYKERIAQLRVVLQLVRVADAAGAFITLPESIDDWDAEETEKDTKIKAIAEHVRKNEIKTENLYRIIALQLVKFNYLVSRLEARVEDPDFYKGIG